MKKSGNNLRVPRYLRHVSGLFCSHKKKNFSFKFFLQTKQYFAKIAFTIKMNA